jgi:hypothetical protein
MSVAKVSEISTTSTKSFEDALKQGIARAHKTLRNVRSAWVKEQQVRVTEGAWEPAAFARELAAGPEGPILLGGTGLGTYDSVLGEILGQRLHRVDGSRWHVPPRHVALLAHAEVEAGRAVAPALLAPVYHRLSEAEEKKRAR